jgi:alpha-amylase
MALMDTVETPENKCLFQTFEWHVPADRKHYQRLLSYLPEYKRIGINALWLPPACKAANSQGNGYDVYDLYDLGEFDQKGSISTKWGSKSDLVALAVKAKEFGIDLHFDAVLNHKAGADR